MTAVQEEEISILTKNDNLDYLLRQTLGEGEEKMKGKIRAKGVCPNCQGKFEYIPDYPKLGPSCRACKILPVRFYVDLNFKLKRIRLFRDTTGQVIDTYRRAEVLLAHINYELTSHTFDPAKYIKADLRKFIFETRIDKWLAGKEIERTKGNLAPSTIQTYKGYAERFYKNIGTLKSMDIREIRAYDIKEFYDALPIKSNKYIKCIMDALKNFFNTMETDGFIPKGSCPTFPELKVSDPAIRWIDRDTQDGILSHVENIYDNKALYFYLTRQVNRPAEARALKVKHLKLKIGTVTIQNTYSLHEIVERNKEKYIKERALNPETIDILKKTIKGKFPDDFVFQFNGRPYSRNRINKIWNDACKKAGVDINLYNGTKHSICSQAGLAGISDSGIQILANHSDIRSTQKYINKDSLDAQKAMYVKVASVTTLSPASKKARKNS